MEGKEAKYTSFSLIACKKIWAFFFLSFSVVSKNSSIVISESAFLTGFWGSFVPAFLLITLFIFSMDFLSILDCWAIYCFTFFSERKEILNVSENLEAFSNAFCNFLHASIPGLGSNVKSAFPPTVFGIPEQASFISERYL